MSKVKLLLDVISDLHGLADSLKAVADAMIQNEENLATAGVEEPAPNEAANPAPAQPTVTREQVRVLLAEKSRNNLTAEVRELLGKYGAKRLSEVDPAKYTDLLTDAEELGNG